MGFDFTGFEIDADYFTAQETTETSNMKRPSSSNDRRHPYLRGFAFWSHNQFWQSELYSKKSKEYFNNWLEEMRRTEPLTRVG